MDGQERIEKAVVELDGLWPTIRATHCCLFTTSDRWSGSDDLAGTYRAGRTDGRVGEGERLEVCPDGWVFVCTYPEFMEARARLENKPDIGYLSAWANFLAQDSDGFWRAHELEPIQKYGHWESVGKRCSVTCGHVFGDWRQSLERRSPSTNNEPHDHKEGGGVKWEPGVDLPPVGEVVEIMHSDGLWFGPARVFHITKEGVCFVEHESGGWDCNSDSTRFRPAKSHRDKVIESAHRVWNDNAHLPSDGVLAAMYDEGILKLPGDEQ